MYVRPKVKWWVIATMFLKVILIFPSPLSSGENWK